MPISLADIRSARATITVDTPNIGPIEVVVRPNVMTPGKESELSRIRLRMTRIAARLSRGEEIDEDIDDFLDEVREASNGHFCDLVESVDISGPLEDEGIDPVPAGTLIPVEPQYVPYLPQRFIEKTLECIQDTLREESKEDSKSSNSDVSSRNTNGARPPKPDTRAGKSGSRRGSFSQ